MATRAESTHVVQEALLVDLERVGGRVVALAAVMFIACAGRVVDDRGAQMAWTYRVVAVPGAEDLLVREDRGPRSCGIVRDGRLLCWHAGRDWAVALRHDARVVGFAFTGDVGCVLDEQRRIACWEQDWVLEVENRDESPVTVDRWTGRGYVPVQVAVSESHGCASLANGRVACWGNIMRCEDRMASSGWFSLRLIAAVREVGTVVAGYGFSCALERDGGVSCWGHTRVGEDLQCGEARRIPGVTRTVGLSADGDVACAVDEVGAVRCWGDNPHDLSWRPRLVPLPGPARDVRVIEDGSVRATLADDREVQWRKLSPELVSSGHGS